MASSARLSRSLLRCAAWSRATSPMLARRRRGAMVQQQLPRPVRQQSNRARHRPVRVQGFLRLTAAFFFCGGCSFKRLAPDSLALCLPNNDSCRQHFGAGAPRAPATAQTRMGSAESPRGRVFLFFVIKVNSPLLRVNLFFFPYCFPFFSIWLG